MRNPRDLVAGGRRRARREYEQFRDGGWLQKLPRQRFLDFAYRAILGRPVDSGGAAHFSALMDQGTGRDEVLDMLRSSAEATQRPAASDEAALHRCRQAFVRSFPRAARILDLGGTDLNDRQGALVTLGYPYDFDELVIIDLPSDERHQSYASEEIQDRVQTSRGPVGYRYHSMADLSGIEDASFDLVYSGQTFEHVTPDDGHAVLAEARRVLEPGGHLCLDTPNRIVTELQLRGTGEQYIDPDHEIEYTHSQMLELFAQHGYEVVRSHGLGLMGQSVTEDRFDAAELRRSNGLYDHIEACYLLAYVCRVP